MRIDDPTAEPVHVHRVAATAVLLRDATEGPEVLLLERPHDRGSFAGAWVFPGGSVDVEDGLDSTGDGTGLENEEAAARRAAVREVREETTLEIAEESLALVACWTPPPIAPKRFRTWFYYAAAPAGDVVLSPGESVAYQWVRPVAALASHAAGALSLVPPTWVTLHTLANDETVAEALDRAHHHEYEEYGTRTFALENGLVFLWNGDVAYTDNALFEQSGGRHRLDTRALPWTYERPGERSECHPAR